MNLPAKVRLLAALAGLPLLATSPLPGNAAAPSAATTKAIETLRKVGPEGQGNAAATAAWQELARGEASSIPALLAAMDGASPLALNWLRASVDAIASRELAAKKNLPVAELERFLATTSHHPRARRLAYELIAQAEPARAGKLLDRMLNDPSTELRRDAVARAMAEAAQLKTSGQAEPAAARYREALRAARDVDQVEDTAKALKDLGQAVNLSQVFGWLTEWQVIGPFDNTKGAGFAEVFPPETKIDLKAELTGKSGPVRWQSLSISNDYGLVDLNPPLGTLKGVTGYAYTEIVSPRAQTAELRLGCKNGWKIWFNNQFVFGRDEYHRGMEIDQYRLKVNLKAGRNTLLVKVCQNEQTEQWTKEWEFQLRITDDLGTPLELTRR